jgi:cathepsin A (carboxypeptidase C)
VSRTLFSSTVVVADTHTSQFSEYAKQDFHIAGESYAGTYIPNIASVIYRNNLALQVAPTPGLPQLNFKSVMIG